MSSLQRCIVAAASIVLAGTATAAAWQLSLGEHGFDWTTVEGDQAHFRWTAEVINETTQAIEVKVSVDLLDNDDALLHTDSVTVTVQPESRQQAEHDGSLPFDSAANVVSFRFRLDPTPAEGR